MSLIKRMLSTLIVLAGTSIGVAQEPTLGDRYASNNLMFSVQNLLVREETPARASRLVALTQMAQDLTPDAARVNRVLGNLVYGNQGAYREAAQCIRIYLRKYPNDYQQGLKWMELGVQALQTADSRAQWLRKIQQDTTLSKPLRAEAGARAAEVLLGVGERAAAEKLISMALQLDPWCLSAIKSKLNSAPNLSPEHQTDLLVRLVHATAGAPAAVARLAEQVQPLGLHRHAVEFYRHLWKLEESGPLETASYQTSLRLANALLDAREPQKAIEVIEPKLKRFNDSIDLHALLAEAYKAIGNQRNAEKHLQKMADIYAPSEQTEDISNEIAPQLAMFYLVSRPDPDKALKYAHSAFVRNRKDPRFLRILGAAEIASGKQQFVESGLERLQKLREQDMYAAVFLAEYYLEQGNRDRAKNVISDAALLDREGPAFRRFRKLATELDISLSEPKNAQAVRSALNKLDSRYLEMALNPQKYLELDIRTPNGEVLPGQPVRLTLTLKNISGVRIALGQQGLLTATALPRATVNGETYEDLPLAVWPAPRYLATDETVTTDVRLDAGILGDKLKRDPLKDYTIEADVLLAPKRRGNRTLSMLPEVTHKPLTIRREDLLGAFDHTDPGAWDKAYRTALGRIVHKAQNGVLPERLLAARRTGSLIALARDIEYGKATPPKPLNRKIDKLVLLRIMQEIMKDSSDVVRAEMIASLKRVPLGKRLMEQISPAVNDASPLVRLRVAECLGLSRSARHKPVVDSLTRDPSRPVRIMAKGFAAN